MAKNDFQIQLKVNNIGPHYGDRAIDFRDNVESNKAIFYALNGTGKTFISRAFRLSETSSETFDASKILSLGTSAGELLFGIKTKLDTKTLVVDVESKKKPTVANNIGLKFHVFNSDFIEENVRAKSFTPDGNIDGYILGKTQIDISDEKTAETILKEEITSINDTIDAKISSARKALQEKGVQANTNEMRLLSKDKVKLCESQDITDTFDQIVEKLDTLKNVPENMPDVSSCSIASSIKTLDEVVTLVTTEYPQSSWDEEFVSAFKSKREFIEKGLEHTTDDNICPFCGREYNDEALELIKHYRDYLADKQAQIQKQISNCKAKLESSKTAIEAYISSTKASAGELSRTARYFPSLQSEQLVIPELSNEFISLIDELSSLLEQKMDNPSLVFEVKAEWKKTWKAQDESISKVAKDNENIISRVNRVKNNANTERLSLRRNLCKAKYTESCVLCADDFARLDKKNAELKELQGSIRYKEQQARISKKEKVFDTLTYLLNQFFFEKYSIDKDTFEIRFLGKNLGSSAANVLSDGEKGIVAFCLYLAYVHQLIESEEDYEKLFFIIDDPISSMDFNYVYAVAQTLREIKAIFNIQGHERIWVFTHNLEFLSIIARNHVLSNVYLMTPGNIARYDYKLLMPYESHLHDIVCIADGAMEPSHTTGNSIRHVIETIAKFEDPQIGLDNYMQNNSVLSGNSVIFSLCQDLSHGNMRSEPPYTPEIMRSACKTVKTFVEQYYPKQIENVRQN